MSFRFGAARASLLDAALTAIRALSTLAVRLISAAAHLPRWRPTDLYAAARGYRFTAMHQLIDQAADSLDDPDAVIVAARTWPWFGADFVYEEND